MRCKSAGWRTNYTNKYEKWLARIDKDCGGKYTKAACPLLKDGKCLIYENRPNCCRSFPKKGDYFCSKSDCTIIKKDIRKNTKKSSEACFKCKNICCDNIVFPAGVSMTKAFIRKWMDVDCETCKKYFKYT